jgi:ornithine cyclodeaminase/alanine dehydrogenase
VAVKHLALRRPLCVTLCGCGRQALSQLAAVAAVRPIEHAYVCDANPAAAQRLANELSDQIPIEPFDVVELRERARASNVVITCTPSRQAILQEGDVSPGCLIAAVGADNPEKRELDPELLRRSKVVVDVLQQCEIMGDLHHALTAGVMTRADVYGELGDIVSGKRAGRSNDQEVIVFDSTGMALQDAAAAVAVWKRATGSRLADAERRGKRNRLLPLRLSKPDYAGQQFIDFVDAVEGVLRSGRAGVMANRDADTEVSDSAEGVFVGDIVTDDDGHCPPAQFEFVEQP